VKAALTLAFGLALGCAVSPRAAAQTPAGLHIQVYAGLTITGAVGTVCSVDYVTDLTQWNNAAAWLCQEFLQLPASPYLWGDKSPPATGKRFYRAVAMEAPTNMVFVPPGTFLMGTPTNIIGNNTMERPLTAVIISRGFWMGRYEVTQAEYVAVTGTNPSWFNGLRTDFLGEVRDYGSDLRRPVENLSWSDAREYCEDLTRKERSAGTISSKSEYRLPREAEWEYACRAWTSTRFGFGDDPDNTNLTSYAWFWDNSGWETHPVGQRMPNPWGLYDMHGNVWEYCNDEYDGYPGGIVVDPYGALVSPGRGKVVRGGSWMDRPWDCESSNRYYEEHRDFGGRHLGFRVVLAPYPP
jgi:formylglycine-generating enzyme required for sulfatase activity